jgi:hypothetical protein
MSLRGPARSTAVPAVMERPASSVMVLDALDALRAPIRGTARLAPRRLEDESTSSLLSTLLCASASVVDPRVRVAELRGLPPSVTISALDHPSTEHGTLHGYSHVSPHVAVGSQRVVHPYPHPFIVPRAVADADAHEVWPPPTPFATGPATTPAPAQAQAPAPTRASMSSPSDWTLMESQLSVLLDRKRIRAGAKARLATLSSQLQAAVDGTLPPGPHVSRAAQIQALAVAVQSAQAEYAALKSSQAVEHSHARSLTALLQQRAVGLV